MLPLKDLAIKNALENNWQEAYKINKKILEENPTEINTLNRLAFSLMKLGRYKQAKIIYQKIIEIDKTNPIALKNLKKVEVFIKQHIKRSETAQTTDNISHIENLFIEEAGKTKTIDLKNITDKKTLSILQSGEPVTLIVKRSKIFVQSSCNQYIGMLPDSIGVRLIPFIKGGNKYQTFVKSVNDRNVSVFIKEVQKSSKFKDQPSFTAITLTYQGHTEKNKSVFK